MPASGEDVLLHLERTKQPGARSAYEPVLRLFGEQVVIDINALTWHLGTLLRLDMGMGGAP